MFNRIFYHSLIRKYIASFGSLFNDIVVTRYDSTTGTKQVIKVPIKYGPKEKWFELLAQQLEGHQIAIQLPRLSFNITSITYDPDRTVNMIEKNVAVYSSDDNVLLTQYAPRAYKIGIELNAYVKNADDGCQIIEQIIPYFDPTFTQQLNLIPSMNLKYDITYELMGQVEFNDVYEGTFQERKVLQLSFPFELRCYFFGPERKEQVIKRVQVDLIPVPGEGPVTLNDTRTYGRQSRIVVKPGLTANGTPTSNAAISIPYQQIDADDDYGFIEDIFEYHDGLKYNPRTGSDG